MALGIGGLSLQTSVRSAPITSPLIIALLLPILMWLAAMAIIALVRRRSAADPAVAAPARAAWPPIGPGEAIDPAEVRTLPAQEIREARRHVLAHDQPHAAPA